MHAVVYGWDPGMLVTITMAEDGAASLLSAVTDTLYAVCCLSYAVCCAQVCCMLWILCCMLYGIWCAKAYSVFLLGVGGCGGGMGC